MNENRLYVLRRQVLKALQEASPATLTTDELLAGLPLIGQTDDGREQLRQVLAELAEWGLISNVRGDLVREPWWKISGDGLAQIGQSAARLDVRIWGRLAVG